MLIGPSGAGATRWSARRQAAPPESRTITAQDLLPPGDLAFPSKRLAPEKQDGRRAPHQIAVLQEFARLFAAHEGEPMIFFSPMLWPLIVWDFWLLQWHPASLYSELAEHPDHGQIG